MPEQEETVNNKLRQRFRPQRTGVGAPLGALETAIMHHVWASGDAGCLAAEVQQALEIGQSVALTTVLTTLDRLLNKDIVRREREGKAYRYRAAISEPEKRIERLLAFAQQALPPSEAPQTRAWQWAVTMSLAIVGMLLLLSPQALCTAHCSLEAIARTLR
jgi:predicted transcriptional regulator